MITLETNILIKLLTKMKPSLFFQKYCRVFGTTVVEDYEDVDQPEEPQVDNDDILSGYKNFCANKKMFSKIYFRV